MLQPSAMHGDCGVAMGGGGWGEFGNGEGCMDGRMKLREWMDHFGHTVAQIAHRLGCTRGSLYRYLKGNRVPKGDMIDKITVLTGGFVKPDDFDKKFYRDGFFVDPKVAERNAAIDDLAKYLDAKLTEHNDQGFVEKLSPPIQMAVFTLGDRLRWNEKNMFFLDGRVTSLAQMVVAANKILHAQGKAMIFYPGVHPKPDNFGARMMTVYEQEAKAKRTEHWHKIITSEDEQ
ncbi:HTH_XRE domain containing protein [uncultured Caudovirales phage]|uniref:HTH_XRE domain containing protein n=1 Tax=uncultured Caudovirales phage TaxID=2100421 RepID=A0A6J5MBE3_9CAUD|nr:HTH_XRE domain containing protein [uncultured Caudovirales phage]